MSVKVTLHTLGCKLNYSETSTLGNQFLQRGYQIVDFNDQADIYLFNTCSVTETAEKECRQLVRRALRKNPHAFIIVTGCYAQLRPQQISEIQGVDLVLGSKEKFNLFSFIGDFEKKDLACIYVSPTEQLTDFGKASSTDADSRTRAFLKVQDGCDYSCSFCTIPQARGGSRSMPFNDVINEFKLLLKEDYKEIILTGVNVGDYGKAINSNLYSLLKKLVSIDGEFRIRVSSIEPNLLTDEIIDLAADNEKMCKHFHIPLQSGSPSVLRNMRRRYKSSIYEKLVRKIKDKIPSASIGVDVIVGFPGETEKDFLTTHNMLRDLPVSYLHVFTYSERPGTLAADMKDCVDIPERKRRNNILRILSEKKKSEFYFSMLGNQADVLFEHQNINGKMRGFSSNYLRIQTDYDPCFVNKICPVILINSDGNVCNADIKEINKSVDLKAC